MNGRRWTGAELAALRAEYGTTPVADLAERFGRTWAAVAQKAELIGLAKTYARRPDWTPELEARYRALHAEGRTDSEIARSWGRESVLRVWLNAHRRRLGLASNRSQNPHFRARCRAALEKQLARAGVKTFADLRHNRCRAFAEKYGLPAGLPPRCVQIVMCLVAGPKTKSEICAALGLTYNRAKPRPTNCLNAGRRGGYPSVLIKRGLVVRQRIPGTGGKGPSARGVEQNRYALTPLALTLLAKGSPDDDQRRPH